MTAYMRKFIISLIITVVLANLMLYESGIVSSGDTGAVAPMFVLLVAFGISAAITMYFYARRHDGELSSKQALIVEEESKKLESRKG